jgi:multiple sugar transport system substrate-binding protein
VPINFESYLLAYRPSILKEKGIAVPTTYDEYYEAAKALTYEKDGQKVYGTITRFDKYWDLTYLTFGTMLQSYGAGLLDEQGNVAVCSPQSIAATELFIKTIKDTSPEGAAAFTWYEALQGFASGQYAMSLDEADLFAPTYENPEESQISEDVGYALTPLGPDGKRLAGAWVWEMSINSASKNKDAAWLFLQWLTSKDVITRTNIAGNMNPVRASSWESAELMTIVEKWGETPGQYIEVMKEMGKVAAIRFPPHPELTRALDRWAEAIQSSYFEGGNVETNLCAAQEDIAKILGK